MVLAWSATGAGSPGLLDGYFNKTAAVLSVLQLGWMQQFASEPAIERRPQHLMGRNSGKSDDGLVKVVDNDGAGVDVRHFAHATGEGNANPLATLKVSAHFRPQESIGTVPRGERRDDATKVLGGASNTNCRVGVGELPGLGSVVRWEE